MEKNSPLDKQNEQEPQLPLDRIFNTSAAKVLDFLLLNRDFDYSESDISKTAMIPYRTLQRTLPKLVEEKLVIQTRKSGRSYMYEANMDSKRTQTLLQYVKETMNENLNQLEMIKIT